MSRLRPCFWCREVTPAKSSTRDHLIPVWFRRLVRATPKVDGGVMGPWMGTALTCLRCNSEKGPMPPAEFARYRLSRPVRLDRHRHWAILAQASGELLNNDVWLKRVVKEMLEPFEHNGERYPRALHAAHARQQQHWRQRTQMTAPRVGGK